MAEKLRKAIAKSKLEVNQETSIKVTASIGVTCFSPELVSESDLFKLADMALYEAKAAGKNQVIIKQYSD